MDLVNKGGDEEEGMSTVLSYINKSCKFLNIGHSLVDETTDKSGVYRPPKLAPVTYDEDLRKSSRKEKNQSRLVEKASRSRIMRDLMAEMDDRPEEVDALGGVNEGMGFGDSLDRHIQEKDKYEENNYVRLAVTRKEKKRLQNNNRMRFDNEFDVRILLHLSALYCTVNANVMLHFRTSMILATLWEFKMWRSRRTNE